MRPTGFEQYRNDGTARGMVADDSGYRSAATDNPLAHRHAFSAGAAWFLGVMLLVAGSTVAMQGAVMLGAIVLIAGLATVAGAAVVLMS